EPLSPMKTRLVMLNNNVTKAVSNRTWATISVVPSVTIIRHAAQIVYMPSTTPFWPSDMFTEFTYPAIATAINTNANQAGIAVGAKLPQLIVAGTRSGSTTSATIANSNSDNSRLDGDVEL